MQLNLIHFPPNSACHINPKPHFSKDTLPVIVGPADGFYMNPPTGFAFPSCLSPSPNSQFKPLTGGEKVSRNSFAIRDFMVLPVPGLLYHRLIGSEGTTTGGIRLWASEAGQSWGDGEGFGHECDHDLEVLVSDFVENGSGKRNSYSCCRDSDLVLLAEKISYHKRMLNQQERDLHVVIHSLLLYISESDLLHSIEDPPCNMRCIRRCLVKFLNSSGYNASLCISKWQCSYNFPGGDHEYVDVIVGHRERMIIDIDFRSHFEIARAVESYDALLNKLPVVYVGTLSRLDRLLQIMAEAAKTSLKQNSMPLPPWRSLRYLRAKWHSAHERLLSSGDSHSRSTFYNDNSQCTGHLSRLKALLRLQIEI